MGEQQRLEKAEGQKSQSEEAARRRLSQEFSEPTGQKHDTKKGNDVTEPSSTSKSKTYATAQDLGNGIFRLSSSGLEEITRGAFRTTPDQNTGNYTTVLRSGKVEDDYMVQRQKLADGSIKYDYYNYENISGSTVKRTTERGSITVNPDGTRSVRSPESKADEPGRANTAQKGVDKVGSGDQAAKAQPAAAAAEKKDASAEGSRAGAPVKEAEQTKALTETVTVIRAPDGKGNEKQAFSNGSHRVVCANGSKYERYVNADKSVSDRFFDAQGKMVFNKRFDKNELPGPAELVLTDEQDGNHFRYPTNVSVVINKDGTGHSISASGPDAKSLRVEGFGPDPRNRFKADVTSSANGGYLWNYDDGYLAYTNKDSSVGSLISPIGKDGGFTVNHWGPDQGLDRAKNNYNEYYFGDGTVGEEPTRRSYDDILTVHQGAAYPGDKMVATILDELDKQPRAVLEALRQRGKIELVDHLASLGRTEPVDGITDLASNPGGHDKIVVARDKTWYGQRITRNLPREVLQHEFGHFFMKTGSEPRAEIFAAIQTDQSSNRETIEDRVDQGRYLPGLKRQFPSDYEKVRQFIDQNGFARRLESYEPLQKYRIARINQE